MTENHNLTVLYSFVRALRRAGVEDVCISPGSRSTPLTLAFVRSGLFRVWTLLDERSSGFFAVGLARVGRPAALVCTSGSATANYHPAVMEANTSHLPLVVLTADRPPELQDVGANQTVDQSKLYGTHVKWQVQMPVPEDTPVLHRHAEATAWRLVSAATALPQGPVHLNWPLREPLIPPAIDDVNLPEATLTHAFAPVLAPHPQAVDAVEQLCARSPRGLFVCGPQADEHLAEALVALSAAWHVPLVADVLSQVRTVGPLPAEAVVVEGYDLWLRDRQIADALTPDWIVRFGGTPTSKPLNQFLARCRGSQQVVVDAGTNWRDQDFVTDTVVQCEPTLMAQLLTARATVDAGTDATARAGTDATTDATTAATMDATPAAETETNWTQLWQLATVRAREALLDAEKLVSASDRGLAFEGQVFTELAHHLVDGDVMFLGNSMPVRDAESFLPAGERRVQVLANRGVSGIDGVVSSAVGAAAGSGRRTVLVIGDVSFFHDQNGLLAAKQFGVDLTVVLVNNDGGGIFSFLPQAAYPETFAHFRTSHGLDFSHTVALYGGVLHRPTDWVALRQSLDQAREQGGLQVIEVRTDMDANVAMHSEVVQRVQSAVRGAFA
ncbi:2-succinyl-5-enolpyruvyl-6-hydroxy-3-cyclohexene-1-carboxylic-acid synthase [Alicyclobacillus sp. ALC3]|uniref:2-succinyl-5-enolpyruvyl-6-hydroxy-3- cyclohexene-1-carboxylic-acid synthase n=1 Tax=Alicyclobacillus sp. ALC3 TaxID=2796143 RepID=UPI0023792A99|nr:2-succinyl-5-enolpyruvyl-6-hydroxy-3-cyclohexene-1-carboxylic-acid synthase [Alicyclobacillus sp. ALC3]WDL95954.1 2-succinyl-5-enolpyruvyl-6-hydroxy-3-cyclohexene-1-carboxylic-acid synthase [Alicyclobacillus sp. ALC3]